MFVLRVAIDQLNICGNPFSMYSDAEVLRLYRNRVVPLAYVEGGSKTQVQFRTL